MRITTLVENTKISDEYENKHGLSFHIETEKHNILFDLGPKNTFLTNAKKLNINLEEVDIDRGRYENRWWVILIFSSRK